MEAAFRGVGVKLEGVAAGYSVAAVARYLQGLGDRPVVTDKGVFPAREAARLVLSGAVRELNVMGTAIRVDGSRAYSSSPIPGIEAGSERAELTYSQREIELVKIADLLASADIELHRAMDMASKDPLSLGALALEAYENEKRRGSPLHKELKSVLLNLLDMLADIMYVREGDRTDALTNRIKELSRAGEFEDLTEHARHRLHITRTVQRALAGNLREVYKSFAESGRHYVVTFDRSGSMEDRVGPTTKKAVAALITLLIAKADPEAAFSLVVFDSTAKVVLVRGTADEVAGAVAEVEPSGGTSYASAVAAADRIMNGGEVLVIVGDFIDSSRIPEQVADSIKSKASKVILIPVGANMRYAKALAKILKGEIYTYRNGYLIP